MQEVQIIAGKGNVYLQKLPKNKAVMDFVCSRFIDSSPERYEIVAELLDRYRTSAGFDPMELSKARFKRVKASEFRKMLELIDQEVGEIMATSEYRQLIARQIGFEPLFHEFTQLSEQLAVHPPASMVHEVVHFEEVLKNTAAYELLLTFYRQHTSFYTEIKEGAALENLIREFDQAAAQNQRMIRHTRSAFVLKALEQAVSGGENKEPEALSLLEELDVLLTAENNSLARLELLLKIIKAALLTDTPNRILENYLPDLAGCLQQIQLHFPDETILTNATLAQHYLSAGFEKRMQWWQIADAAARAAEADIWRAQLRLIKAAIVLDAEDIEKSLRSLDEAEHQIHKANKRNPLAKNTWISICRQRFLLYALNHFKGVSKYSNDQYHELIRLTDELAKHRKDSSLLLLEMKALLSFIQSDWETAAELFEKAVNESTGRTSHPYYFISTFFYQLLRKETGKKKLTSFVAELQLCNDPFYTFTGSTLIVEADKYYQEKANSSVG